MAICDVCSVVLAVDYSDNDGTTHFACYGKAPVAITATSTGPAWIADPSSGGKIAYALQGTLSTMTMTDGDNKFLWDTASIQKKNGLQVCGSKGSYFHESGGASRIAKKDRSFMSVFFLEPEPNKIVVHGIGNHAGGKGATHDYKVAWQDGSTTTFTLGNKTDKPPPK